MAPRVSLLRHAGWRRALAIAAVIVLLAVVERGLHSFGSSRSAAPGALWIWTPEPLDAGPRTSFLAVRDLHLDQRPERVEARLLADESYLLDVNGERVGSNFYRLDASLDVYDVTQYLKGGANRIVIEVRSRRVGGGLLFGLVGSDSTTPLVVSDRDWSIFHHDSTALRDGLSELTGGLRPRIWQSPRTGRWGSIKRSESRPTLTSLRSGHSPATTLAPLSDEVTTEYAYPNKRRLHRHLDFGRRVSGYLVFGNLGRGQRTLRMLTSDERAEADEPWEEQPLLEEQTSWRDAEVRVFRWLRLDDRHPRATVLLIPVDAQWAGREVELLESADEGVFGLEPPPDEQLEKRIALRSAASR